MDILKKALSAPAKCNITPTHVSIETFSLPRDTAVPLPLSREYKLDQLCFYIINSDLAYTEYLKKCRSVDVLQVSYVDQKKLIEEIKSYKSVSTIISFDPKERHRREEDYSFVDKLSLGTKRYKVLVPSSYQSLLNLNNAKEFLENGVFRKVSISFGESPEVVVLNQFVVIQDNAENWSDVVAVFLDGSKLQYRDWKWASLREMTDRISTFFLYSKDGEEKKFENLDVMPVKVSGDGKLSGGVFDMMWKKINSRTALLAKKLPKHQEQVDLLR